MKMRPIDAVALKDKIRKYANEPSKIGDRRWDTRCTAIIADMNGLINNAPTVGGWISVEDELPELGALALVYANSGQMAVARYIANNQWVLPAFFPTVTHWALLPEAPKEDVDDET